MTSRIRTVVFYGLVASAGLYALQCDAAPDAKARAAAPDGPRLPNGKANFLRVKDALLKGYYDDKISEDDLYRAALKGMLMYMDPRMEAYNHLLEPDEMTQLKLELSGEFLGIGVQIKFDDPSGVAEVLAALPGSAAEKAGLIEGDKILSVNGKTYKGLSLRDMVYDIRGPAGGTVNLAVLRGATVMQKAVLRERVVYDNVNRMMLPGQIGYFAITGFNAKSETAARTALGELRQQGAKGLIVDLRDNGGGAFDQAVAVCGLLLAKGQPIVQVVRRGEKREMFYAKGDPALTGVPVAVLVNGGTSSGAEFFAGALRERLGAALVGEKTFGKWSVQTIEELPEKFAVKYTVSLFRTPSDRGYDGQGLVPDVQVNLDPKQRLEAERQRQPEARLQKDVQLRTALRLLAR